MEWKIYYGDGHTFSDEDGSPKDASPLGVQVIVQSDDEVGRRILHGYDYYWYEGEWFGGDVFGLWDFLARAVGPVRFGRLIPLADFREIYATAQKDPDFKRKSALGQREREPR